MSHPNPDDLRGIAMVYPHFGATLHKAAEFIERILSRLEGAGDERCKQASEWLHKCAATTKHDGDRANFKACARLVIELEEKMRTFAEAAKILTDRVTADEATIKTQADQIVTLTANQKSPDDAAAQQLVIDAAETLVPSAPPADTTGGTGGADTVAAG